MSARQVIFDNDLAAFYKHKNWLVVNCIVHVVINILDLLKHPMYNFYYNQLKKQYGKCCQLLYTDEDCLLLEIETRDVPVCKGMWASADIHDTSNYPRNHPLHSTVNKKVLDERRVSRGPDSIVHRLKMYSILRANKKGKEVKKNLLKKQLQHEKHKEALFGRKTFKQYEFAAKWAAPDLWYAGEQSFTVAFQSRRRIAEKGWILLLLATKLQMALGELLNDWELSPAAAE